VFEITFRACDRLWSASVSPDGLAAYCLVRDHPVDLVAATSRFWPEASGVVVGVAALLWVARLVRVLRRPRASGRPYCRGCNYDVVAQAPESAGPRRGRRFPAAGTLCPECGVDLSVVRPARGRSLPRRLLAHTVVLTVVSGAVGAMHAAKLPRNPVIPGWMPVVRSDLVDRLTDEWRIGRLDAVRTTRYRAVKIDTRNGSVSTLADAGAGPATDCVLAPDGRFLAFQTESEIRYVRTSDSKLVATTALGALRSAQTDSTSLLGIHGEGQDALVFVDVVGPGGNRCSVRAWNPMTGSTAIMLEEEYLTRRSHHLLPRTDGPAIASRESETSTGRTMTLWTFADGAASRLVGPDTIRMTAHKLELRTKPSGSSPILAFSGDGEKAFYLDNGGVCSADLRSGACTVTPGLLPLSSSQARICLSPGGSFAAVVFWGGVDLHETSSGSRVGSLRGSSMQIDDITFSADEGRLLVCDGFPPLRGPLTSSPFGECGLRVYSVPQKQRNPPRGK
jgi:hypothetical protein